MASDHFRSPNYISAQIANTRETLRLSEELLGGSMPDTFTGRKTQEPFPADDPLKRPDIQNLLNSELKLPE